MAAVSLNLAPGLRPWRQAGVTHLLVHAPVAAMLRNALEVPKASRKAPAREPGFSTNPPYSQTDGTADLKQGKAEPAVPSQPVQETRVDVSRPAPATGHAKPFVRYEPVVFSPSWQSLWEQVFTVAPRPITVWTYAELGMDLRGQPSQQRRATLQALLGSLHMPKGTHAFWPYRLPDDPENRAEFFLSGLMRLRPAAVFVLGDKAAEELAAVGEMPPGPLQEVLCRGFRFIRLPDLAAIDKTADTQHSRLSAFIKTMLS